MTFKRVLADSGLTKSELAELYGVSRQTIHAWAAGTSPPRVGSYTARMQTVITNALCNAIDRKLLPLKLSHRGSPQKEARRERITKMAATLQSLKPAARES